MTAWETVLARLGDLHAKVDALATLPAKVDRLTEEFRELRRETAQARAAVLSAQQAAAGSPAPPAGTGKAGSTGKP